MHSSKILKYTKVFDIFSFILDFLAYGIFFQDPGREARWSIHGSICSGSLLASRKPNKNVTIYLLITINCWPYNEKNIYPANKDTTKTENLYKEVTACR